MIFLKISIILFLLFLLFVLIVKRFIYFQPSYEFLTPIINFQDIYLGNLHAWYIKGQSGKIILFCHGNAGNLSFRQEKLIKLHQLGHSVLIFDYSGYGHSKGVPNEQLVYSNAMSFIQYILRIGYKSSDIILYGESLGGAIASFVANKLKIGKIILESSIPGMKKISQNYFPKLSFLGFVFDDFNTEKNLHNYQGQILLLHSLYDEIVPIQLMENLKSRCQIFIPMSGSHNNPVIPWSDISSFINS
jgi:hypothetical protein